MRDFRVFCLKLQVQMVCFALFSFLYLFIYYYDFFYLNFGLNWRRYSLNWSVLVVSANMIRFDPNRRVSGNGKKKSDARAVASPTASHVGCGCGTLVAALVLSSLQNCWLSVCEDFDLLG